MISLRDVVTGFGNRDPLAEVWRRDLRGGGSSAEIKGTLPLSFSGRGKPLTDYLISGNTIQNGTPSPVAPVDVAGCGVWDETQQSCKLPLTVNGTEYPIYLGQTQTTRRIKKLVLTGQENLFLQSINTRGIANFRTDHNFLSGVSSDRTAISSHFYQTTTPIADITEPCFSISATSETLYLKVLSSVASTPEAMKAWLAAQYANGTPVTVWYVLAEPETGIVNEPLMKIGDYADTISFAQSGVAVPTVSGANVLDMTSPVKPSEVYIKGKSIKPTGYGQLVDNNGVRILDKNNVRILVHGQ